MLIMALFFLTMLIAMLIAMTAMTASAIDLVLWNLIAECASSKHL